MHLEKHSILTPQILEMNKPRPREVRGLAQGQAQSEAQDLTTSPGHLPRSELPFHGKTVLI